MGRQVHTSDAHQFTWDERESLALPKPDIPVEYTHFHFECMFPFWAPDQLTASTIRNGSMQPQSNGTPRIPHQNIVAAWLFQHQHPTMFSGKGLYFPDTEERVLRVGSWTEEDWAPSADWRQCSPQSYLGGRHEIVPSSPLLLSQNGVKWGVPRCLKNELLPKIFEASLGPRKEAQVPTTPSPPTRGCSF